MLEDRRRARNEDKLAECHPGFRERLRRVLVALERQGFRPRIQEGWRSPADQLTAYNTGRSHLRYGLHNATGAGGRKEALAADVLDDDLPTAPGTRYLLALAVASADAGLDTGILWGLSGVYRTRTAEAVRSRDLDAPIRVGWDPTHVQVRGITAAQARAGQRPTATTAPTPAPRPNQEEEDDMKPVIVKPKGPKEKSQYFVAPGAKPLPIRDLAMLADLRNMYPELPEHPVEVSRATLDALHAHEWAGA